MFNVLRPFLENFIVFGLLVFTQTWAKSGSSIIARIDFLTVYIVFISIMFGVYQGFISILLSSAFLILRNIQGGSHMAEALVDLDTILRILEIFIIGTLCGYSRDRMRTEITEKQVEYDESRNELETILKINDANIKIKQALDEKLTNYGDSLAKIYSVIENLNSLQPYSLFFETVNVVMDIMRSNDVSIYVVTGNEFKMCRLMAKTPSSARAHKSSVPLDDLGKLSETISRDEIFVNRDLIESLPMMAAPVFSKRELVSIIMIWDIEFENLTLYNVNRFLVLSRLISSVIERAYIYASDTHNSMVLPGTNILTHVAFKNILNAYKEASDRNTADYQTIIVTATDPKTGLHLKHADFSHRLQALLRINDYMAEDPDSETRLYALLANTNNENLKHAFTRLEGAGLSGQEVVL